MLKKKILGAKVLDTNGYVLATRLIVPTNSEKDKAEIQQLFNLGTSDPVHQLGDIYNANMVDVVARAVSQGDTLLNQQINAETAARIAADNNLSDLINLEVSDRKQAITDLINGAPEAYDTLKEISDYIAEDKDAGAALVDALSTETSERKEADEAEEARAKAAELENANAISTETTRAKDVESTLRSTIVTEASSRAEADTMLKSTLETLILTTELSILAKAIVAMQSSSYDKDTNTLTQIFVKGDGSTVTYTIDLSDVVDANDISDSDSTTMSYSNGAINTSVNTLTTDEVNALF